MTRQFQEGFTSPLGAHLINGGINIAVFAAHATKIEWCIYDEHGQEEWARFDLVGPDDGIFHGFLQGATAGLIYGLRAHGPYAPHEGHRFNPNKLLLDPYAREIVGGWTPLPEHHGYQAGSADAPNGLDATNNEAHALKARVTQSLPPAPRIARRVAEDIVLYEVHVKGFSKLHREIPEAMRGTYAALAHPASIAHFKALGVTTLSLLPVQYHLDEPGLTAKGLVNYWGYNTLGFFAADPALAYERENANQEFRAMVDALHKENLEVVLDVVYNHTAEGSEWGTTISFRGLDNRSWYWATPNDASRCENYSGCGNALNVAHPRVAQFVLDSLRYWVTEMGVDGFRFDLAPVLGRTSRGFQRDAAFFAMMKQDPVLSTVRMIAEPWDAGNNGYQVGNFPAEFLEWNDKFRDSVRSFWLGTGVTRGELARRFTASSDVFSPATRRPQVAVNYIAVHDGFCLNDVVSYSTKHNHANGEDNRDGRDGELCSNFGVEGDTDNAEILQTRDRVRRAMMATLLLAQGTPMLCAGDEIGNSQRGNNNAYCQDNPVGWLDWPNRAPDFTAFVGACLALRKAEPLLHHHHWFEDEHGDDGKAGVTWLNPAGCAMQIADWHDQHGHAFATLIRAASTHPHEGSARLLIIFNPDPAPVIFQLHDRWTMALDSSATTSQCDFLDSVAAPARSVLVLRAR